MKRIIEEGIQRGEFKKNLDAEALVTFVLSLLEGGIMLSKPRVQKSPHADEYRKLHCLLAAILLINEETHSGLIRSPSGFLYSSTNHQT